MITSLWRHQPRAFYVKISKKFEFSKTFYSKKEAVKKKKEVPYKKENRLSFLKIFGKSSYDLRRRHGGLSNIAKNEKRGPLIYGKKPLIMSENHQTITA